MKKVLETFAQAKLWTRSITRRKLCLLGLGGLLFTIIVPPLLTVVSCGTNVVNNTTKRFSIVSDAVLFDITKLDPSGFIAGILGTIGTQMDVPIYEMTPSNEQNYNLLKNYLNKANFTKDIIRVSYKDKTEDLNFSEVHHYIDELKKVTQLPFATLEKNKGAEIGLQTQNIYASDLTRVILDHPGSMGLADWLKMYEQKPATKQTITVTKEMIDKAGGWLFTPNGMANVGDTYEEEVQESIPEIITRHPYLNLLRAYHKVFWSFIQTDLYKEWSKDKKFIVAKNDSPIVTAGTHKTAGTQVIVRAGEMYDLPNSLITDDKGTATTETSNLEFQFFYSLLGLL